MVKRPVARSACTPLENQSVRGSTGKEVGLLALVCWRAVHLDYGVHVLSVGPLVAYSG
jgi:hypothetical protein